VKRRRLDLELVARGLVATEQQARDLIDHRRVAVGGSLAMRPSTLVAPGDDIRLAASSRFVSRGGDKLDAALDDLGVDVGGRRCLDAGAGSGGFTHCLLTRGATEVVAVDVGYGQFEWSLRGDHRVRLLERTNLRLADPAALGAPFDVVVADLSFISLALVLPTLDASASDPADFVLLVKPQFEAPAADVGRGGVVRDPEVWRRSIGSVAAALGQRGLGVAGIVPARPRGARGNQEFFVHARRDAPPADDRLVGTAVESAS
jgi:23S rRNA (cytidine1920-2'-O)/16S rRNA (cytidine1409-2'-O)-methyltransferase